MFEITEADQDKVTIETKKTKVTINVTDMTVGANLEVGEIHGPGEFEIGEIAIRGIATENGQTIYDIEMGGVHIGVIGGVEQGLDDLGVADILCTSSVRAVREIEPKMVVSMGNIDGMVADLKLTARMEKKLKVKSLETLPAAMDLVVVQ